MTAPDSGQLDVLLLSGDPGVPLYGPSGASAHLRGIVRALVARGHRVRVAVPRLHDDRGVVDDLVAVPVITARPAGRLRLPGQHRETALGRRLLATALSERRPDVLWERYSLWCDAGGRATGLRHILEVNAPLSLERLEPGLERSIWRDAGEVVAVSAELASRVRQVRSVGVRHVPNGTDAHALGDRDRCRAQLGLRGLVVGFVGSLKPWHGLACLPELLRALPEATALVVGTGPAPPDTHPRVVCSGRVEPAALPDLLAAMDVGIAPYPTGSPSWFCPLKVLDYLAAGVPVVATDVGDCAWLLRSGGGETLPPPDRSTVDRWAAAIRRQSASERIPQRRGWDAVVREVLG